MTKRYMTKNRKERLISEAMALVSAERMTKLTAKRRLEIAIKASKAAAAARKKKAKK